MEFCFELIDMGIVFGIQDMGVVGLICFSVEMVSKVGNGLELYFDQVLQCEEGMIFYEMMLFEFQEWMLFVVELKDEV